uniref:CEA cell adhesion molecule 21 n=1 Tax=Sus scrofa TaxID=9823 RepID=A0A4X1W228_PIG
MEPPSAPGHRGHVPWHRLLLAVSLLTFWNLPTTAQITVESVTFNAVEGRNILLLVHNATENVLSYHWYRGDTAEENQLIASHAVDFQLTIRGPAHSGREIIYPNGSLLFQNVTLRDSGNYTLMVTKNDRQKEIVTGQLRVFYPVAKPIVEANSTTVTEHEDTVVLKCLTNDTGVAISWFFNGQSLLLTERMELSQDNGTLTIEPVRREDAGHYQCEASHLGNSSKSDPLRLDVKYPVAKPIVEANSTTVTEHEDTVVLKCLTNDTGSPSPVLQWPESTAHREDGAVPGQRHPHHRARQEGGCWALSVRGLPPGQFQQK